MDVVTVKDKQFSISIPESRLRERVAEVAQQISRDLEGKNPLFLAVLNGAFMFAADLMRGIDIPAEISFVRFASYQGMQSTGQVKQLIGLTEDIKDRTVVVIEDIIDSGLTMQQLLANHQRSPTGRVAYRSIARQARQSPSPAQTGLHLLRNPQ